MSPITHDDAHRSPNPSAPVAAIQYSETMVVEDWEARWLAGSVPSRWPYGLDELGAHGFEVRHTRAADRLDSDVLFGFDERVAPKLLAGPGPRVCGAIWVCEPRARQIGSPRTLLRGIGELRSLRRMDHVICYSTAMAAKLPGLLRIPAERVSFVPLGIDPDFYQPSSYEDSRLVLSVGNDRSRDTRTLYAAFRHMLAEDPHLEIVVQTSDPAPAPAGVRRVSRFRDHAELKEYYRRAAVVAIASRPNLYTSGSTVALEAQAVGRPVIISNTPGMESYVEDGLSGFLTEPGDHRAIATAALSILRNPEKGDQMGRVGSARVRSENTIFTMTQHIAAVFGGVLARRA